MSKVETLQCDLCKAPATLQLTSGELLCDFCADTEFVEPCGGCRGLVRIEDLEPVPMRNMLMCEECIEVLDEVAPGWDGEDVDGDAASE